MASRPCLFQLDTTAVGDSPRRRGIRPPRPAVACHPLPAPTRRGKERFVQPSPMMRLLLAGALLVHGAIHLLGFLKAFGFAALPQLTVPIPPARGLLWLAAAVAFVAAAIGVLTRPRWWWMPTAVGLVLSTIVVAASWQDAKAGAVANGVLAVAAIIAFAIDGPTSQRARFEHDVAALTAPAETPAIRVVTDADLAPLPAPVQRYLRAAGVVGHPRVTSFRLRMHGRIRSAADAPWMPIVAEQVNTIAPPARLFYLDATMHGLPVTGLHRYLDGAAAMDVRLLGLLRVAHDDGAAMTHAETVTFCNDLCLFAPATLIEPAFTWTAVSEREARLRFTAGAQAIEATLVFGADGRLSDFFSDDRGHATVDGPSTAGQRWSTPIAAYRRFGPFTLIGQGEARWHAPAGAWPYITLDIDDVSYGVAR